MKKLISFGGLLSIILAGVNAIAAQPERVQRLYCIGGVDYKKYNLSRTLVEVEGALVPTWLNESDFDNQNYIFKVEALGSKFHYQIILKDQNKVLLDEEAAGLPKLQSVPINNKENVFIHCREMTPADFCRYFTC